MPVDVLALPRATTLRLLVMVVALLVTALFAGTALHNAVHGEAWDDAVGACTVGTPGGLLLSDETLACLAPAERTRAGVAVATALVVALGSVAVVVAAPAVLRRRKRLDVPDARFAAAAQGVAALAAELGVAPPRVLVARSIASTEAFCLGHPGRYAIALPRSHAIRPRSPAFRAIVRHELSHLVHRDVALSWLARSTGYVLVPVLAVPIVLAVAAGSIDLAADQLWRSVVLAAVVLLAQRAALRSREFDADLRACRAPGMAETLVAGLTVGPAPRGSRFLRWHPEPLARIAALRDPARTATVTALDGLTVAFLVALALPILTSVGTAAFLASPALQFAQLTGALVAGPLMGAALAVGLWRHALVARACGRPARSGPVVLGVVAGGTLGQVVTVADVGLGGIAGGASPALLLVIPLAMGGATALLAGLGELWATAAGRARRPSGVWVPAVVLGALLFTTVLWAAELLRRALDLGGWPLAAGVLTGSFTHPVVAAVAVVLALAVLRCHPTGLPAWMGPGVPVRPVRDRRPGAVAVGCAAGVGGVVGVVVERLGTGPVVDDLDLVRRVEATQLAAVAAAVVAVGLLVAAGRGAGPGLLAGPLAAGITGVGFLGMAVALGGTPDLVIVRQVVIGGIGAGLLAATVPALLGAAVPVSGSPGTAALGVAAAVVATLAAAGVLVGRGALVPDLPVASTPGPPPASPTDPTPDPPPADPGSADPPPADPPPTGTPDADRDDYAGTVVLQLQQARSSLSAEILPLDDETDPDVRAARIRERILPPLRELSAATETLDVGSGPVRDVHQHAVAALRAAVRGWTTIADGLDARDEAVISRGKADLSREVQEWRTWLAGVDEL